MGNFIDLTGQKFGRQTVVKRAEDHISKSGTRIPAWECKCECGETRIIPGVSLRSGNTKSCGCYQRELQKRQGFEKMIDLTGKVFGALTVIERGDNASLGETRWKCRCDCGNEILVRSTNLRRGKTKSCGCKKADFVRESKRQTNVYEFHDDYVIGYTSTGTKFYFDKEDYELVSQYCWCDFGDGPNRYVTARMPNGKNVLLHRLIANVSDDEDVDHLNHDGCDDRRQNLRIVTHQQNMLNTRVKVNNKSGVPGVWWDEARNKWQVYLTCKGVRYRFGRFDSFDDAVAARKSAEERYFGEYSYDNSIAAVPRIDAHTNQNLRAAG